MTVSRRSVLAEALRYRETVMKQSSVNGIGLRARRGMEETFERYQEECRILRELMQALEYEPVKAAIAEFLGKEEPEMKEWQLQVIKGGKQVGLFGHQGKDGADHPEGREVSGRKDPGQ